MLFEPFNLAGLSLRNRIVRAATYERAADEDGFVTEALRELYGNLSSGGCGLIITGNALVHPSGRAFPLMLCVHSDIYIERLRGLAGMVHEKGGLIALQLNHGGRQSPSPLLGGNQPLAPSEVLNPRTDDMPKAMTDDEIWQVVYAFGGAALRAQRAGFDAVELHGAHGFLISSFLSGYTNKREDYWGGDEERRFHFLEEVYKAVREAVGKDFPVLIKINSDDFLPGGVTPEESAGVALRLETMGLDAVEISGGTRESSLKPARPDILKPEDEAYFRTAAGLFKKSLRIPVILTGGMRSRVVMEDVLEKGQADLIGMSRPLLREPDLPNLMREGKERADCLSCMKCMRWTSLTPVRCKQVAKKALKEPL